ncbi:hypothetical protein B0H65DRAFT_552730 [Neurospora tetraspora]|uniref:Uncharacterized protein n=1 Tax=Neurospora tetraspora TaxID=94610 RepID=A0AAE0J809_9PEZI|nr:hypothetical protein B0H65DRAFT_552730 [Neurospora tetraspora]
MSDTKANPKTQADTSSGSGTNKGPSTGAASEDTGNKKPILQATQTCDCNHTGSCTCAPGSCACFNCPNPSSSSKESKAAPDEEWTVL